MKKITYKKFVYQGLMLKNSYFMKLEEDDQVVVENLNELEDAKKILNLFFDLKFIEFGRKFTITRVKNIEKEVIPAFKIYNLELYEQLGGIEAYA
jgi:hypothetical protein